MDAPGGLVPNVDEDEVYRFQLLDVDKRNGNGSRPIQPELRVPPGLLYVARGAGHEARARLRRDQLPFAPDSRILYHKGLVTSVAGDGWIGT